MESCCKLNSSRIRQLTLNFSRLNANLYHRVVYYLSCYPIERSIPAQCSTHCPSSHSQSPRNLCRRVVSPLAHVLYTRRLRAKAADYIPPANDVTTKMWCWVMRFQWIVAAFGSLWEWSHILAVSFAWFCIGDRWQICPAENLFMRYKGVGEMVKDWILFKWS